MKRYKAIQVGLGSISKTWVPVIKKHPNIELVGLVDLDRETALKKAEQYELDPELAFTDLAACIKETGAEVVFDTTVPPAHHSVVLTAIAHGCHVFGEKPLSTSMPHAVEMVAAAAKAGVTYGVMQNRRWQPTGIGRVKAALDQGVIGKPHTFHTDFFIGAHFAGFRADMEHVLFGDMAIHSFDQIRFLTEAAPVSVIAKDWNPPGSWYADGASAVAFFEHEDNVHSSYRGSWCAEGLDTSWNCDWRIVGTKGTLLWDGEENIRVEQAGNGDSLIRPGKPVEVPMIEPPDKKGHTAAIHDFIESIINEIPPATPASDNIYSLAMVYGAIASAEAGTPISINSLL